MLSNKKRVLDGFNGRDYEQKNFTLDQKCGSIKSNVRLNDGWSGKNWSI